MRELHNITFKVSVMRSYSDSDKKLPDIIEDVTIQSENNVRPKRGGNIDKIHRILEKKYPDTKNIYYRGFDWID